MSRRPAKPPVKQPVPAELQASLLAFVESKFYQGHPVAFAKDLPRLLPWVIYEPARWLKERGVTISTQRYGDILRKVLLPAWLQKTVQSHLAMHGEEIYYEAKSMRNMVENALAITGQRPTAAAPDVVNEFTAAHRLLKAATRKTPRPKRLVNAQLSLI